MPKKKQQQLQCPACADSSPVPAFIKGGQWYECPNCETVFIGDCSAVEQSVGGSGEDARNDPDFNSQRLLRVTEALYRENVLTRRDVPAILDYGCGSGIMVDYMRSNGINAEGYDPANERFGVLPVSNAKGRLHAAIMVEVIEHLQNPIEQLQQIQALLVPGGVLMVESSFRDGRSFGDLEEWEYVDTAIGHVTIYEQQGLHELMRRAGFAPLCQINANVYLWRKEEQPPLPTGTPALAELPDVIANALAGDREGE